MRICLVYDCLFPYTVGGAERWYRNLAQRLVAEGHDVTYLTLRQWDRQATPDLPGVQVRAVGPRLTLYTAGGRRRTWPPIAFGLGVLWHLMVHGRRYDAVHTASFPYFSLIAAALVRKPAGYRLVVDWHEVWSAGYWREYLGLAGGTVGLMVQCLCAAVQQQAFCFSDLHALRLGSLVRRNAVTVLRGEYDGPMNPPHLLDTPPRVVFAGRLIPEKRVVELVHALAVTRNAIPLLHADIYGDGPERAAVMAAIRDRGVADMVTVHGFVDASEVAGALTAAMCLVLPSRREGYGLVVVEAGARGTPSIVCRAPDNAAVELIREGENGFCAESAGPQDLAAAIERVWRAGNGLRRSTRTWFESNADTLALSGSLEAVVGSYRGAASARS